MKHYGLLGERLSHSYSAIIHNYVFEKLSISADYSLLECREEELKGYMELLKQGRYSGFNVTIPYKKKIIEFLDKIDDKALRIGSVNTIYLENGKVIGTNTDYDGFYETIKKYQVEVKNKNCYILGTGGASLAVRQVLEDLKGNVTLVSRTPTYNQIGYLELEKKDIDILVNTTPVGMYPNMGISPISKELASRTGVVIDIIFNPFETQLLKDACSSINGLYMLVMQAIKAEEIWQKKRIELDEEEIYKKLELMK